MDQMNIVYEYQCQTTPVVREEVCPVNTTHQVKKADASSQTLSVDNLVRQVLISKVADNLQNKGLEVIACAHTRGLYISDIITDIVDRHSDSCAQRNQHGGPQGIPLQGDWLQEMFEPVYPYKRKPKSQVAKQKHKKPKGIKRVKKIPPEDKSDRKCPICSKTFKYPVLVKAHMSLHRSERPFQCEKCDYKAKSKYGLNTHNKFVHENKYPYFCKVCGKGIRTKPRLIEHENYHLDKKDYPVKCTYCDKRFTCEYNMKNHLNVHEKERQMKCDLCPQLFFHTGTLSDHLKNIHGAVKSYKHGMTCLTCDKEFNEWPALLKHMKDVHDGETFGKRVKIKCDFCPMTFFNESLKKGHMKKVHKVLIGHFHKKCVLCDLEFSKKDAILEHMTIHHKEYIMHEDGMKGEKNSEGNMVGRFVLLDNLDSENKKERKIVEKSDSFRVFCFKCNHVMNLSENKKHVCDHNTRRQHLHKGSHNMGSPSDQTSTGSVVSKDLKRTIQTASTSQRGEKPQKVCGQDNPTTQAHASDLLHSRVAPQNRHSSHHTIPQVASQPSHVSSISIVSSKENLDKIKKSVLNQQCWLCGKETKKWNEFFKHISEEHKDQLAPNQDIAQKNQTHNQSCGQSDQTIAQTSAGNENTTIRSSAEDQTTGQSSIGNDGATDQPAGQINTTDQSCLVQNNDKHIKSLIEHGENDQTSSLLSTQKDQETSRPSVLKDQTSQSTVLKDQATNQSALEIHMLASQLPNQTDHTTNKPSLVQKDDPPNKSL